MSCNNNNRTTSINEYMQNMLLNAENNLSEGDYLKFANNMKKLFSENLKNEEVQLTAVEYDGYYKIPYGGTDIYWKPPPNWSNLQIQWVLQQGDMTAENSLTREQRKELIQMKYTPKMFFKDIMKMRFKNALDDEDLDTRDDEDEIKLDNSSIFANIGNSYEFDIDLPTDGHVFKDYNFVYYVNTEGFKCYTSFAALCKEGLIKPILLKID